jgi:hypothetical protein
VADTASSYGIDCYWDMAFFSITPTTF